MKTIYLFIFFICSICSGQIINIPDLNFKARLLQASSTISIACIGSSTDTCLYGPIDTNGNGEIEVAEAAAVARLNVFGSNISDLTGIDYFVNLDWMDCANNNLSALNISSLVSLKVLGCYNNQLTSLDISNQSQLELFFCLNNQISTLDFTNNIALKRAYCDNNLLSGLDFSNNPNFFDLGCRNNPNLTTLKIRNGMTQVFGAEMYINECWDGVPNLNYICADGAEIPALQSFLAGCGITQSITIDSDCPLGVVGFDTSSFVVYPNPVKNVLSFLTNQVEAISAIRIYNTLGQLVQVNTNPNETIDVSGLKTGTYFIQILSDKGIVSGRFVKE